MHQLLKFLPPEAYGSGHHQTDQYIELVNGSIIMYGGLGNDVEAVKKISNMPELGWIAIDQAEDITERQFLLLDGRLRLNIPGIHYKLMLTANPEPGWLRDRFIDNVLPDHRFIPALPQDNPKLPPDYAEKLKQIYPEALVKRLLEGDWDVDLAANYLIPYSQIREAIKRNLEAKGDKVAGVDISREGDDETVFILRQGNKVLHIVSWSHQDTTFSAGRVSQLIRDYKPEITYIDSVGIGAGVFDPLNNEGFAVTAINVGEKALDNETYANKRAEYFNLLAKKFQAGEIDIPDNQKLQSQLSSLKYHFRGTKLLMESKEVMKKRGFKSPDYADALMLAFIGSDGVSMGPGSDKIKVTHWG